VSKAGCSIALIVVAAIVAGIFYFVAPSMVGLDEFFRACTPGCAEQSSARQVIDLFPALLICAVVVGLLFIMRMSEPSDAPRVNEDQSPN